MTILITGGAGYIGSNLARSLIKKKLKYVLLMIYLRVTDHYYQKKLSFLSATF